MPRVGNTPPRTKNANRGGSGEGGEGAGMVTGQIEPFISRFASKFLI